MVDYWATRDGVETAAAIRKIPQELRQIRELLEKYIESTEAASPPEHDLSETAAGVAYRASMPPLLPTDPLAKTTPELPHGAAIRKLEAEIGVSFAEQRAEAQKMAREAAQNRAVTSFTQHIAPIMQIGEMHTIYDSSDSPQRQGKRLGIVTRGERGWLIEDAMIRMGPHGDERKALVESRKALSAAIGSELSISRVARPEPHPKHENAIKMYFKLLGAATEEVQEYFLGYLASDVADFIMNTPFGEQHTWSDGAKLDVLSFQSIGKNGLRANLLVVDAHWRDEARSWVAEMESVLFEDHVEEE